MAPLIGRDARMFVGGVVIAYAKTISVKASAEIIKDYSMDSVAPAVSGAGKQSYTWSVDRLNTTDGAWLTKLVAGTPVTIVFGCAGTVDGAPFVTLTSAVVLSYENSASETGAVLQKVSGEAQTMAATDA